MSSRRSRDLTSKEVNEIIKTCCDSGISELKFRDLRISFKAMKEAPEASYQPSQVEATTGKIIDEESFSTEAEVHQKDDELANMYLENPDAFEEGLARGDFVDVGDAKDAEA